MDGIGRESLRVKLYRVYSTKPLNSRVQRGCRQEVMNELTHIASGAATKGECLQNCIAIKYVLRVLKSSRFGC